MYLLHITVFKWPYGVKLTHYVLIGCHYTERHPDVARDKILGCGRGYDHPQLVLYTCVLPKIISYILNCCFQYLFC